MCVCIEVGKMAKDIGMTIRKGIAVSFLPCLFHPYNYVLSFFNSLSAIGVFILCLLLTSA